MRYRVLGRTGLFVSQMSLGTLTFGQNAGQFAAATGVGQEDANAMVRRCVDAGINLFDTANAYGAGQSEQILGTALKSVGIARQDVVLATKVGSPMGQGPNQVGGSRTHLMDQVRGSLQRLGTDHIDLYQMHAWDPATPIEHTVRALEDMVRAGYVRYVGICNVSAWQLVKALCTAEHLGAPRFESYQAYYSLVGRELERELLPLLVDEGLGFLVYSPLASGFLSGKYRGNAGTGRRASIPFPKVDEQIGSKVLATLEEISKRHGVSVAAVALAWICEQPAVTSVLVGAKTIEQLDDNLKAADVELNPEDLAALEQASALPHQEPTTVSEYAEFARKHLLRTGKLPQMHQ